MADADKPVARLQIDTRAYGPLICEHCADHDDEMDGEREEAILMEDGAVVCHECRTPFKAFEQFSGIITSVGPIKLKGRGHVCGDSCRRHGCKYYIPEEEEKDNPRSGHCAVHNDEDECSDDPSSCRFGGCDGSSEDGTCKTAPTYFADTKSFFCKEHRKKFLEDYRWDDSACEWVERS